VHGDETPVRVGPGPKSAKKKYLHVACTSLLTCCLLGDRDLPSFREFIYSDLHVSHRLNSVANGLHQQMATR
jgi:hypothetical protein